MKKFLVILLGFLGGFLTTTFATELPFYKKQSPPLTQDAIYRFIESNQGAGYWNISQQELQARLKQRTDYYIRTYGISSECKNIYSWTLVPLADYFPTRGSFETDYIHSETREIKSFYRDPYKGETMLAYQENGIMYPLLSLSCGNTLGLPMRTQTAHDEHLTFVSNPSLGQRTYDQQPRVVYVDRYVQQPGSVNTSSAYQQSRAHTPVQEVRRDNTGKILLIAAAGTAAIWGLSRVLAPQPRGFYLPTVNGAPGGFGPWNTGPIWGGPGDFTGWGNSGGGPGGFTGW